MFVAIWIISDTICCFVQKTESIITFSINIKLDFISVLPVYDISDCRKILWLRFCAFCYYKMIFRTNQDISVPSRLHPFLSHIAFFRRFQAHYHSPPASIFVRYGSAPYRPSMYCLLYAAVLFTRSLSSLRISYSE